LGIPKLKDNIGGVGPANCVEFRRGWKSFLAAFVEMSRRMDGLQCLWQTFRVALDSSGASSLNDLET
jgi:hypothetical protein